MARTRSIKPGFFHDTKLTAQSPLARLLFSGLWCYADREGRLEDDARQIKHDILPDDRCNIEKLLSDLASGDRPFIYRYEVNGRRYIQIRTWKRHENPHQKEPASIIPPMPESETSPVQAPDKSGTSTGNSRTSPASRARVLEPSSLVLGTGNREPGTERAVSPETNSNPPAAQETPTRPPALPIPIPSEPTIAKTRLAQATTPIQEAIVRQTLAQSTGKPIDPDDWLPLEIISRAANLGAHPGALCRWIAHQAERAARRGSPPTSAGFFASTLDAELPAYLAKHETEPLTGTPHEPGWARIESVACPACSGAMTRFADGLVINCLCRTGRKRRGIERAKVELPAQPSATHA